MRALAVNSKSRNEEEYGIKRSRLAALSSSLVHIVPIFVTFYILQLSFRNVYWEDAGVGNQRVKLAALQIAAKVHEILILISMSSVVLHYTRKLLVTPTGISFGLLETAYQSGLSSNPWTIGNWEALKHLTHRMRNKNNGEDVSHGSKIRAWHLVILLVFFAFLALFVGPASAITLIPQLGWWPRQDLIGPLKPSWQYALNPFSVYIPINLFPTEVDESYLPGPFCLGASGDINNTCPSARIAEVRKSFLNDSSDGTAQIQNVSISLEGDDHVLRRMLFLQVDGMAAVTVPNYLLASFASLIRPKTPRYGLSPLDTAAPFTLEIFANGAAPLDPLVGVDCRDNGSDSFLREFHYQTADQERTPASIDIRSAWSEDELNTPVNGTRLVWRDVTNSTKTPVLLALVRHEQNVTVCTVQSYWTSTSQWVLSTSSLDVATNFTFSLRYENPTSIFGYSYSRNTRSIHIHEKWAETLNTVNGSTSVLSDFLQLGINNIKERNSTNSFVSILDGRTSRGYLGSAFSQILAKSIANGLSRIGAQYAADRFRLDESLNEIVICNKKTHWCSQGTWMLNYALPLAVTANTTRAELDNYFKFNQSDDRARPMMRSFPKPADADQQWTRINIPVSSYGYGYSFSGITTYLSVALLCFHAALVLIHVVYRVTLDCQVFDFGGSLGSLLVLAMGDRAPTGGNMWRNRVAVVPFGNAAERTKLKLDVIEPGFRSEEKVHKADPEEVVRLVTTMQINEPGSRYPSARK